MTRIQWNSSGERFYETGIEKAVLYVDGLAPTPWNGLISVTETAVGGDVSSMYYNGVKYLDVAANQEFKATITSYEPPYEFDECIGLKSPYYGLSWTQQVKKEFNLTFKTLIGNDIDGYGHGYKLHLIYSALASPSSRPYSSMKDTTDPIVNSWSITALPQYSPGFKPTPYRVIDSRKYTEQVMTSIENILYGTSTQSPRFPSAGELTNLLGA